MSHPCAARLALLGGRVLPRGAHTTPVPIVIVPRRYQEGRAVYDALSQVRDAHCARAFLALGYACVGVAHRAEQHSRFFARKFTSGS